MTESLSMDLHKRAVVVDAHVDTIQDAMGVDFYKTGKRTPRSLGERSTQGHVDIPRLLEGGVDVQIFAISAEPEYKPDRCTKRILQVLDHFYHELRENSQTLSLITRYSEIEEVVESGKVGAILSIEGGEAIEGDLAVLRIFYQLGVRAMTLTWSERNQIADGVLESRTQGGLTRLGVEVVKEMNRLGMMVDVSHISDKSFYDVIRLSKAPIIASHSSCRALCENPRNIDDNMLLALKQNGGVIQICIFSNYVKTPEPNPELDAKLKEMREKYGDPNQMPDSLRKKLRNEFNNIRKKYEKLATVKDAVDHIDHVVQVIGIDHVGIGTDFDGGGGLDGCRTVADMKNITIELVRRGYSKADIEKIWGGNVMRVLREVEKVAQKG